MIDIGHNSFDDDIRIDAGNLFLSGDRLGQVLVDIIVIDSVAALVPKAELDGEMGDSFMGVHARLMSQAMRKLTGIVAKSNTCLIFINQIRDKIGVPVLTDIHEAGQCARVAEVADVLQIPAFLCRQTDLLVAAARTGRAVHVKKGQFLAPHDMKNVIDKARDAAREAGLADDVFMACERGASFGYNNLVSDMRSLAIMRETGCPVVFDATHSVQLPGGQGATSGGQREFVPVLARAAIAVGVAGVFMETHPDPAKALCDGPNAVPLQRMRELLSVMRDLDALTKRAGFLENDFN